MYKEDFTAFNEILGEMTEYVINHKGEEVISERHQKDFKKDIEFSSSTNEETTTTTSSNSYTDINFDDI